MNGVTVLQAFAAVVRRDLMLALRRRADVLNTLVFFVIVVSLFPLGVGPEMTMLRTMAPGIVWVAALLASMLALSRLFAAENTSYVSRLVLIDGGGVFQPSGCLRPLIRLPVLSNPIINMLRKQAYSVNGLKRAIADEKMLTPEFVANAQAASIGFVAALRQIALTTPPSLRTPTCPTLVIWGELDRLSTVDSGRRVAAEINGAKLTIIPHAAHMPQIEQPDNFLQVAQPFLLGTAS